jgi:uncharacterized protein (TIGR02265 family)
MSQSDEGFALPDWKAPFDAAARIAQVPEGAKIKGLYFHNLLDQGGAAPEEHAKYLPFIDYSLREYMELLVATTLRVHPGETLRGGLRLMGRTSYPTFGSTLIGKTIFGRTGHDFGAVLDLASRAYEISLSPGTVAIADRSEHRARIELRDVWSFHETYHVGVLEGACAANGVSGEVRIRVLSPCDADFEVTWVDAGQP